MRSFENISDEKTRKYQDFKMSDQIVSVVMKENHAIVTIDKSMLASTWQEYGLAIKTLSEQPDNGSSNI